MSLYIQKRNNTYYFRVRIPQDLQQWFSGREIKKSLKTTHKCSAKISANAWQRRVDSVFTFIRSGLFSEDQLHTIIQEQLSLSIAPIPQVIIHSLPDIANSFIQEQMLKSKWTDKTQGDYRKVLDMFIEFAGEITLEGIDRKLMVEFVDCLSRLPANIKKKPAFNKMKMRDIVKLQNIKPMSSYTVNKYLSRVSAMLLWCVRQGYLDRNPAEGLALSTELKEDEERKAYSLTDIEKIISLLGKHKNVSPERYFVPLVAMFSGMRLNEICQLYVSDVKQVDGVWCFDINDDGDKRLKNKASRRVIPVHPKLIELGLLEHVDLMLEAGEPRVWMNLVCKRDGFGQDFGKWYQRFNRQFITQDRKKVFHSFRHLFCDTLKQKGVAPELIAELVGHSNNHSITVSRYGKRYRPQVLLNELVKLDYQESAVIIFKRFTDSDYIAMGKSDVWEINRLAQMVTWFSFQERAYLENIDEAVIYEEGDCGHQQSTFKNPESKAFTDVLFDTLRSFEKAYLERHMEAIERLELNDLLEGRIGGTEYCVRKESALEFLETNFSGVNVEKLRSLLSGEIVTGRKDTVTETIVRAYGAEVDQRAAPKSMAQQRHDGSKRFKDALKVRIDDYFSGDCQCTSKTAFEEIKKRWDDEDAMKADVKVGYYSLNERIKKALIELEQADPEKIVRRNQAKGYSKDKIPTSCPKHRRTILK